MNSSSPVMDNAPLLERCFQFEATPASYEITGIEGRIPEWLRGSYYINGPTRFERGGRSYTHWLDGDGMVCRLHFGPGKVTFTNRFVDTAKVRDEEAAGTFIFRAFGTAFPGDKLHRNVMLEGPVNVAAYRYAGTLVAFGEQTLPYELDPVTLETRGTYDFHGRINDVTPFAAHAKFDGHLMNFGINFAAAQPMLNTFEFDSAGVLLKRSRYPLPHQYCNHDMAFTKHHMVFFFGPLLMDFGRFLNDGLSVMDSLVWKPEVPSRIHITPRAGYPSEAFSVEAGGGYCLHTINAFEDGDRLALDLLLLDEPVYKEYRPLPEVFTTVAPCRPVRYWIDLKTKSLVETVSMKYDRTPDFPNVGAALAGKPYNDFWMLGMSTVGLPGRKFFDQMAHGSWAAGDVKDVYQVPRGEYLGGEPNFVPNPENPREGVVISEYFRPAEGAVFFLLFDAFNVAAGPIARLPLKFKIHPGLHTSFTPDRLDS